MATLKTDALFAGLRPKLNCNDDTIIDARSTPGLLVHLFVITNYGVVAVHVHVPRGQKEDHRARLTRDFQNSRQSLARAGLSSFVTESFNFG